jgi:hypothetical protein
VTNLDLYSRGACDECVRRIEALRVDDRALWGKFNAILMVSHCQAPLRVALGELKLPRSWIGRLFGSIAKKSLTKPGPFKRGLPTDPRFLCGPSQSFTVERAELIELVRRFVEAGSTGAPRDPHPFFGPLTPAEWSKLMAKHLDHHLRQFGR